MSEPVIRLASLADVPQLVALRREFKFEDDPHGQSVGRDDYEADCRRFLEDAIIAGSWRIWVAEHDGEIISHAFVALVEKVPSPVAERRRIGYLTNVYTRPAYRNQGIGTRLIKRAQADAAEADVELLFVWPSERSVPFYNRLGFTTRDDPLVWNGRGDEPG